MLVIGRRGAAGLAPENTLDAMRAGLQAGADILELTVQLTHDNVLVLVHDLHTVKSKRRLPICRKNYDELVNIAENRPSIIKLEEVLDRYFGTVLLNIQLKSRASGEHLVRLLKSKYIKHPSDWDNVLISSFKVGELLRIRLMSRKANLALIHSDNPFAFIAYHRLVKFTAVGFHRLHINRLALEIAHKAQLFTYVYTIDRPDALSHLASLNFDGVVTDYPDKISAALEKQAAEKSD